MSDMSYSSPFIVWLDICSISANQEIIKRYMGVTESKISYKFTDADACIDFITDLVDAYIIMNITADTASNISETMKFICSEICSIHSMILIYVVNNKVSVERFRFDRKLYFLPNIVDQQTNDHTLGYDDNQVIFNVINKSETINTKNKQEATFMYSQLLRDVFCQMDTPIEIMIDFCRRKFINNKSNLKFLDDIEKNYYEHSPIDWYTRDGFLYRILNDALRTFNVETLVYLRSFIKDLHLKLLSLHQEFKNIEWPMLYRGVCMPTSQFNTLTQQQGCLLSFNQFLSTTYDQDMAMIFAGSSATEKNSIGVLFKIIASDRPFKATFANIMDLSHFGSGEQEVLFSMGSTFRIEAVKKSSETEKPSTVRLNLTDEDDIQLTQLTERFHMEMANLQPDRKLNYLLFRMCEYKLIEQVDLLYMDPSTERSTASLFNRFMMQYKSGDRKQAVKMFVEGLELEQRKLSHEDPKLLKIYRQLAYICSITGQTDKALKYYLQYAGIEHDKQSLANAYGSIGRIYEMREDFYNACIYYRKDLELCLTYLPANHPDLAISYFRIGAVFNQLDYYLDALEFLKASLVIQQSSLPEYHEQIADTHYWVGSTLALTGNNREAIDQFEKAIEIGSKTLGIEHIQIREYIKVRDFLRSLVRL